jgi:transglutaminase-like putative cysteine protease
LGWDGSARFLVLFFKKKMDILQNVFIWVDNYFYMTSKNINYWTREGEQSKITPKIRDICSKFKGDDYDKLFGSLNWIEKNIHHEKDYESVIKTFASRDAEQVIENKNHTGCHDTALILATFLRASKIPSKYLVGISKINPANQGHCVVEAYLGKRWILIDPSSFQLNLLPSRSSFYANHYIVKEGLDSWDCGIKTFDDWKKVSQNVVDKVNQGLVRV